MKLLLIILLSLFLYSNCLIQICKYVLLTTQPASLSTFYTCSQYGVQDRICSSTNEVYEIVNCEQKNGGAVNILTEFGVKYLYLGDAYAAHYLTQH